MRNCFREMVLSNIFQRYVIKNKDFAEATPISVQRAIFGDPGITYKYFDIRLFAFPWGMDIKTNIHATQCHQDVAKTMYLLNERLKKTLKSLIDNQLAEECAIDFNMSLLNHFDPVSISKSTWQPDEYYAMGLMAIKWHKDPFIQKNSTVAVYQCEEEDNENNQFSYDWSTGFRKNWSADVPAIKVHFENGDCYFMTGNFNDNYQHCVIAGTRGRFSSTHRKIEVKIFDNF